MPLIPASSFRRRTPETQKTLRSTRPDRQIASSAQRSPRLRCLVAEAAAQFVYSGFHTDGAEEDAGVGSRQDGLKSDTVATAFPKILCSLKGDPLSHGHGADPSGLQRRRRSGLLCGGLRSTRSSNTDQTSNCNEVSLKPLNVCLVSNTEDRL